MKAGLYLCPKYCTRHLAAFAAILILAAACGDNNDGESTDGTQSLSISGTPPSQIMQGTSLDFAPTVSNPNDLSLSFSASNLPGWASLNTSTGRITGTPDAGDLGMYSNIKITVSGGGESVTSPAYSIEVVAAAFGSATLTWLPPTERTDGTPLTNLAGYKIYYGQHQYELNQIVTIPNPGLTSAVVDNLTPATWYFAATAYDADGVESALSNMASKTIM